MLSKNPPASINHPLLAAKAVISGPEIEVKHNDVRSNFFEGGCQAVHISRSSCVLRPPNDKSAWVFQSETGALLRRSAARYPMEVMIGRIRALQLLLLEVTAKSWLCRICVGGIGLKRGDPHRLIPLGMADHNLNR